MGSEAMTMTILFFIGIPALLFVVGMVFARFALTHDRCRECPYYRANRCAPAMLLDPLRSCPRSVSAQGQSGRRLVALPVLSEGSSRTPNWTREQKTN